MPNHVSHNCVISGPKEDLDKFVSQILQPGDDLFNFEKIIPMPKELDIKSEHSSSINDAVFVLTCTKESPGRKFNYSDKLCYTTDSPFVSDKWESRLSEDGQFCPSVKKMISWYEQNEPETLKYAKQLLSNYEKYGNSTWYGWRTTNWGTKWSAYQVEWDYTDDNSIYLKFQTAWSPPTPILNKLVEMFPTLNFYVACFDEGHCFAGRGDWKLGDSDDFNFYSEEDLKKNPEIMQEIYTEVYGYPYEKYNEDEDL